MAEGADKLKLRLKAIGLNDHAINAAWPGWWSDDANSSVSARAELSFSLSRKLGLDPRSLLDGEQPRFLWPDAARFKHLAGESETEKAAISSFGTAIGRILINATPLFRSIRDTVASDLRQAVLQNHPFPRLVDLISICWSVGIPIIHLRVFPLPRKRMSAMAVRVGPRCAILIGRDSNYPPHIAFYVAHELAHIALGHLENSTTLVDFDRHSVADLDADQDELAADRYALDLLTGRPNLEVSSLTGSASARALAEVSQESAVTLGIEPGTLALCFGYSTQKWEIANGAMQYIYSSNIPVWRVINDVALDQLSFGDIPKDTRSYLGQVLGNGTYE